MFNGPKNIDPHVRYDWKTRTENEIWFAEDDFGMTYLVCHVLTLGQQRWVSCSSWWFRAFFIFLHFHP